MHPNRWEWTHFSAVTIWRQMQTPHVRGLANSFFDEKRESGPRGTKNSPVNRNFVLNASCAIEGWLSSFTQVWIPSRTGGNASHLSVFSWDLGAAFIWWPKRSMPYSKHLCRSCRVQQIIKLSPSVSRIGWGQLKKRPFVRRKVEPPILRWQLRWGGFPATRWICWCALTDGYASVMASKGRQGRCERERSGHQKWRGRVPAHFRLLKW